MRIECQIQSQQPGIEYEEPCKENPFGNARVTEAQPHDPDEEQTACQQQKLPDCNTRNVCGVVAMKGLEDGV
jgi:hypothetical protein